MLKQLPGPLPLCLGSLLAIFAVFGQTEPAHPSPAGQCVILLHGLARTSASMSTMAERLQDEGYSVINVDYPSRHKKIEELADIAVPEGLDYCRRRAAEQIHFVTHSLGGILVRYYLENNEIDELGRVVMLAPPNQGSRVVDEFSHMPGYALLNGPAGKQLGKGENSIPLKLGPADFEVGIIAGDRTINLILSTAFDEPNDGKVAVHDTRLEGMKDFLVVHRSHPFIMQGGEVIDQALHFLEQGFFLRQE
ncbi:MAG: alpha/beta fold hydrolase [Desulfobulbaceae bacterium]|nr:alpha/beta fold hydrolase [Desulfobulbaceae bacterium]